MHSICQKKKKHHSTFKDTHSWSGIDNIHKPTIWIGFPDCLQHLLIFETACTKTRQRLAAATDRRLVRMQIGQCRETSFRSKAGTAKQHRGARFCWHVQLLGVGIAKLIILVQCAQTPLVVRNAHSFEFIYKLEVIPPGGLW